jgi:hypothetical protein
MKKLYLLLTFIICATAIHSQKPCSDSSHRQFDFWIGKWEAYATTGKLAGTSNVELILDSCIIVENWTSSTMFKGVRYAGKSYNSFNVATGKWQQYWVDNVAGVTEYFNGHAEKDKMILETAPLKQADGIFKITKMTFFNLGPDKVRQFGESTTDEGKTWKVDFDLEYRRVR